MPLISKPCIKLSLQMARELAGYSIEEASTELGLTMEQLNYFENQTCEITLHLAVQLTKLYSLPLRFIKFNHI